MECYWKKCNRDEYAAGLCKTHYTRRRKGTDMDAPMREHKPCSLEGCDATVYSSLEVPFCQVHRHRKWTKDTAPIRVYEERECSFDGCDKISRSQGLCPGHYRQKWEGREMAPLRVPTYRYISSGGYVVIRTDEGDRVEHRVIMEEAIGRPLRPEEEVHHRNGVRTDNRLSNLELWSTSHPAGQRIEDKVVWAKEILALYDGLEIKPKKSLKKRVKS